MSLVGTYMYQPKVPQVIEMRYFVEHARACGATLCDQMIKSVHLGHFNNKCPKSSPDMIPISNNTYSEITN